MISTTTRMPQRRALRWIILAFCAMAPAIGIAATAHAQAGFRPRFQTQAPFAIAIGAEPGRQAMALADLNGDQRPDLLTIEPAAGRVAVQLNTGSGGFGLSHEVEWIGGPPNAVAVADVASPAGAPDGVPDLLIGTDDGALEVFLGIGDGTFALASLSIAPADTSNILGIAVGQFDAAPGLDVALLDAGGVRLLCNTGGALGPCGTLIPVGDDPIEIVTGDFNGDARADLAVLDRTDQRVLPLLGRDGGGFDVGTPVNVAGESSGSQAVDIAVGRIDDDAIDDLVIANRNEFLQFIAVTLLGTPRGVFRALAFVIDFDASALALGDFDNGEDGAADLLVGYAGTNRGGVTANIGDATGSFADPFAPVGTPSVGAVSVMLSDDLNGDGIVDVVVARADGASARVLINETFPYCAGDCNANGTVSIDELMRGVRIILGEVDARDCIALDVDGDLEVRINELVAAVGGALQGCPTR